MYYVTSYSKGAHRIASQYKDEIIIAVCSLQRADSIAALINSQDAAQDANEAGKRGGVDAVVNVQQLKAEILRYADEGIELCFGSGCDERIATRFEKIIAKLSAV